MPRDTLTPTYRINKRPLLNNYKQCTTNHGQKPPTEDASVQQREINKPSVLLLMGYTAVAPAQAVVTVIVMTNYQQLQD